PSLPRARYCGATRDPCELPTSTPESSSSRAASGDWSAMPCKMPVSQAIPAIPPPASTNARLVATSGALRRRVLRPLDRRAQVGPAEQMRWRVGQHHAAGEVQSGVDVDKFSRFEQAPARVVVHRFAGEHDRRARAQML